MSDINYRKIIDQMSLEEKAKMMSGENTWRTWPMEQYQIPSMYLSDGPHGIRKQEGEADHLGLNASIPATCFPTAATIANSWDEKLGEELGKMLGEEAACQGVNILLGPGLNMKRSPLCGRNFEYFSEDPYLAGKMAAAYVRGIQSKGIAACPKHFAVNSQELRRMCMDSVVDERTLREIYTTGFEIAVKEGKAKAIMSAYNQVNEVYANENKHLLQDILVDEWGFDGIVVSDWGGSNDHALGVLNGSHLEMPGTGQDGANEIIKAVKNGTLPESALNERLEQLLKITVQTQKGTEEFRGHSFDIEEHHRFACKAEEESIVLLKNEENILPLQKDASVCVIGDFAKIPRYQGAGSSVVNPTKLDSVMSIINQYNLTVRGYSKGYLRTNHPNEGLLHESVKLAKTADYVLLMIGLDEISESEGLDRVHMKLPDNQVRLLEAIAAVNQNIIVVLSAGSVVEMQWEKDAKAIVHGYLCGQAGAGAVLNVITGKVCPSGKLNETYPVRYEDTPAYHYFPSKEKTAEYREGPYIGYRYYETAGVEVKYPFGYGLSYTQFEYSDLELTNQQASFTITNTGKVDGAEIAQLYVGRSSEVIYRPKKELKGFYKVFLKAGESKQVVIPFDDKTFRYFDVEQNEWKKENGDYSIMIGANVSDIRLTGTVTVADGWNPTKNQLHANAISPYFSGAIKEVSDIEFETLLGRTIPKWRWKKGQLDMNDALGQMIYGKGLFGHFVYHILTWLKVRAEKKGKPDLNILFLYNMPFRGLAKMTGGVITMEMAEAMNMMANGHFFRGFGRVIRGFFRSKRKQR